jgi:hypothetical protein
MLNCMTKYIIKHVRYGGNNINAVLIYIRIRLSEVLKKFDELENAMRTHLGKVDPLLIVDLILRQKKEEKNPIYTLEVFVKPNPNTEEIKNRIINETGMVPAFYDGGTHVVVAHRINFDMLKMINDIDDVERIRGTYAGGGMASIGPVYD